MHNPTHRTRQQKSNDRSSHGQALNALELAMSHTHQAVVSVMQVARDIKDRLDKEDENAAAIIATVEQMVSHMERAYGVTFTTYEMLRYGDPGEPRDTDP